MAAKGSPQLQHASPAILLLNVIVSCEALQKYSLQI